MRIPPHIAMGFTPTPCNFYYNDLPAFNAGYFPLEKNKKKDFV